MASYFPITDPTWIFFVVLSVIIIAPMILERLRIPSVVGLILVGMAIGPHGFHVLERDGSFELFGKVGLYYIMFLASLEMNLQDVQKMKNHAATLGLLSFGIPMIIGFWGNHALLGYGVMASVLMAAMYASHTLISYPIVLRYGISRQRSVSIAVGGTIVADTLVLLVLAVVGGMFKEHVTGWFWVWLVLKVIALGVVIIALFPLIGRWFFRRYDDGVMQYIFVLGLVFLGAGLMELVGMEGILGAFLVGIVLNRLIPPSSPLMSHLEFVGNALFIPYFLIGVGMIINARTFFGSSRGIFIAAVMVAIALASKWLAAFATQKIFKMSSNERGLIFGLTNSRAAATLAVVLVGYNIILPDGQHLFDEYVLNGAMMLILVTCIVSSMATERKAQKLISDPTSSTQPSELEKDKVMVALSNPDTAAPLINLALTMRQPKSPTPITAINIVLEDKPQAREEGLKLLQNAVGIGAAANVKVQTHSRWSVNVVSGMSHAMKEFDASDLLIGLHDRVKLNDPFFGKLTPDLLHAIDRQVIIYRPMMPINLIRRIHLVLPRKAEFEPGFAACANRIAQIGSQISCNFNIYCQESTLKAITKHWNDHKYNIPVEYHRFDDWHDLIPIAHLIHSTHMLAIVAARKDMLSYNHYMEKLPDQLERYFSSRNLMLIYPSCYGNTPIKASAMHPGSAATGK